MPDQKLPDPDRLAIAKEIIALLNEEPSSVQGLIQESDRHCCEGNFPESIECCQEAYELALERREPYAQGSARLHMGLHHFVWRVPDYDRAADMCEEASRAFHSDYKPRAEIVALVGGARVQSYACRLGKDRWHRALALYLQASMVAGAPKDIIEIATTEYNTLTKEFSQHSHLQESIKNNTEKVGSPTTSPEPSAKKEGGTMSATLPQQGPHGNYAISVVCHEEKNKRPSAKFSPEWLWIVFLGLLAVIELIGATIILQDTTSKIFIYVFFVATLVTFIVLFGWFRYRVTVPPGYVGVITGGASSPRLLSDGSGWLNPLNERLYDFVPLGQHEYKCRLEFREYENSAPVLFQDVVLRYTVVRPQLGRAVVSRLADQEDKARNMREFWETKLAARLQRFFEDMSARDIDQGLDAPRILEAKIFEALRASAIKQNWGIVFIDPEDVHLGFYRNEKRS